MIGRLIAYLGGGKEAETPRKGVLSARSEWHAVILGVFVGFVVGLTGRTELLAAILPGIYGLTRIHSKALYEMRRESWYAVLGIMSAWIGVRIL